MKHALLLASAVAMLAAGAASAQDRDHHRGGDSHQASSAPVQSYDRSHEQAPARRAAPANHGSAPAYRGQSYQSQAYRGQSYQPQAYRGGTGYNNRAQFRQDNRAGDWNHNGVVDHRFDRNRDGVIDHRFDRNGNGNLDKSYDANRNGRFDSRAQRERYGSNGSYGRGGYGGGGYNSGGYGRGGYARGGDYGRGWNEWRGGRGPWMNDRNWFHNNWSINASHRWYGGGYRWPYGYGYRSWAYGEILPSALFLSNYFINDYDEYGLYEPPYGYQWVRVGSDILLVDPESGQIVQVVHGAFYG